MEIVAVNVTEFPYVEGVPDVATVRVGWVLANAARADSRQKKKIPNRTMRRRTVDDVSRCLSLSNLLPPSSVRTRMIISLVTGILELVDRLIGPSTIC